MQTAIVKLRDVSGLQRLYAQKIVGVHAVLLLYSSLIKVWIGLALGVLFSAVLAQAQKASQMGISTLYETAVQRVHAGDLLAAIPVLKELIVRFEGTAEADKRAVLEEAYRFLAMAYMQSYNHSGDRADLYAAVHYFSRYLDVFPEGRYTADVLLKRADCYRVHGAFGMAAEDLNRVLTTDALVKSMDPESRADTLEKLCSAYVLEHNWEAALPWLSQWLEQAPNPEQKAAAVAALVEAHIELEQFKAALEQIPLLIGSDAAARYRIALNLALLKGGDTLTRMERYSEAALFYAVALSPEQILRYFKEHKVRLKNQLKAVKGIDAMERRLRSELLDTEQQIQQVSELTSYVSDLEWRRARSFSQTGRSFEAFWAFLRLAEKYPEHQEVESFIYGAFTEALNSGLDSRALKIAEGYLARYRKYRREISVRLAEIYAKHKDFDRLFALGRRFVEASPNDAFSNQFVYWMGNAWIERSEWAMISHVFDGYIRDYPETLIIHGCYYWKGLAALFAGDFQSALEFFSELVGKYPDSPYVEDASFRIGVCYFGLRRFQQAQQCFEVFVRNFPNSVLLGEAEGYLGDVAAAQGAIEQAIQHYGAVEQYTQNMHFIDHAYFQRGKLLEANGRYRDMVVLFRSYLEKYEKQGNLPGAIYELGKANALLGHPVAMLEDYFQAIVRFGNDPRSYGVDRILEAYQKKYYECKEDLSLYPSKTPEQRLTRAYYNALQQNRLTLAYRLQRALEEMGRPIESKERFTLEDFKHAGPKTLIWIGAKVTAEDRALAREAYRAVIEHYDDSEAAREAYLKLGEFEAADLNYAEAYQYFKQAQDAFPSGNFGAQAAMRQADMLLEQELYAEALEHYKTVLNTREWRGRTWAEASYKMGLSFLNLGKFGQAHGFFERTFLAFEHHTEWASRAYLKDGETLERMGERVAARNTYEEFLANPSFRQTEVFHEINVRYHRLK